ncbi:hypothetical protein A5699_07885 [Mycobacterium sp. E802]|uniref:hypothetical protein n=1 Tax=Mycobacterium sp. E802 TaxID=1834152 RepID=UPI0007FDF52F|nr:hypothetical protein [Mycobacterium sp. E802]OBG81736.1 hypothetical protein A5699_07885 [Mycobacterium sp. E802]
MTETDPDHALREWKRKVFDDSTATIPRVFLNVARRHVHPSAHAVGYTNSEHGIHTVTWLNGSQFGVLSCEGSNDDSNVAITGAVIPLAELKQVDIAIEDQRYDEVSRRVTQWTRRATFTFSGKKDFTLHSVEALDQRPDKFGDFIDRVLLALVSYGQAS